MKKRITPKNTKTEILEAYEELLKEKTALEGAQKAPTAPIPKEASPVAPSPPQPQVPLPSNTMDMEQIIASLGQLNLTFGGSISALSEKLVKEAVTLAEIQSQLMEENQQLIALHNIEIGAGSLEALISTYETSAKSFAEELKSQREGLEQTFQLECKSWKKEQEDHQRAVKERQETLEKTRQREGEEYRYRLQLERQFQEETFTQELESQYRLLEERQKQQEKQWAEQEEALTEREKRFADLKAKVEAMPEEREAALKKAREEGKGIAGHQAKVKADLYAKEVEGQKHYYELRIQSLQETIQSQEARIQNLASQLDAALKQVQDLAVKAIEGTSNMTQSQVLREIALEQAKQAKGK